MVLTPFVRSNSAGARRAALASNVLSAVAGPLAAGIWFSDALGLRDLAPHGASVARGLFAAAGVATSWAAFFTTDAAGAAGALRRGLLIGVSSVGAAAGATLGLIFGALFGICGCLGALDGIGSVVGVNRHGSGPSSWWLLGGSAVLFGGAWSSVRVWHLATRAPRLPRPARHFALESTAAVAAGAGLVWIVGGAAALASVFGIFLGLFVALGLARNALFAAPPARRRADA